MFDLSDPVEIPAESKVDYCEATMILNEWLSDEYRKSIFGEMSPFECMKKIKHNREPNSKVRDTWLVKISKLSYNSRLQKLSD